MVSNLGGGRRTHRMPDRLGEIRTSSVYCDILSFCARLPDARVGRAAKEFRNKLEARATQLRQGPASRATTTVWDAKNTWWEQHVLTTLKKRTRKNYERAWDKHLEARVDGLLLVDLTASELERLKGEMLTDGVGASTVKTALAVLGSVLAFWCPPRHGGLQCRASS